MEREKSVWTEEKEREELDLNVASFVTFSLSFFVLFVKLSILRRENEEVPPLEAWRRGRRRWNYKEGGVKVGCCSIGNDFTYFSQIAYHLMFRLHLLINRIYCGNQGEMNE